MNKTARHERACAGKPETQPVMIILEHIATEIQSNRIIMAYRVQAIIEEVEEA